MNTQNSTAAVLQQPPAEAVISGLAFGALTTQAIYVAAKLGIADLVKDNPVGVAELAEKTGTHERALYRVLRSLAGNGIFEEVAPKVFAQTYISEILRSDAPNSMRNGAIFMGEDWHWKVWGNLLESVKTGNPSWKYALGDDVFDYFAKPENAEQSEIFNNAMTDMSVGTAPPIVEAYDFSGIETIADIAGGHGVLLSQILQANPGTKGILFDLPHVLEGARSAFEKTGVSERVEKVSGDFFREVPSADAYIMKHIIHDWDDEKSVAILKNIHQAMTGDGKVLICEVVVPEGNEPHYSKLLDMEMLVSPGGIERTEKEYGELLAEAGFRLTRIIPTKSPFSIIEAVKA